MVPEVDTKEFDHIPFARTLQSVHLYLSLTSLSSTTSSGIPWSFNLFTSKVIFISIFFGFNLSFWQKIFCLKHLPVSIRHNTRKYFEVFCLKKHFFNVMKVIWQMLKAPPLFSLVLHFSVLKIDPTEGH